MQLVGTGRIMIQMKIKIAIFTDMPYMRYVQVSCCTKANINNTNISMYDTRMYLLA